MAKTSRSLLSKKLSNVHPDYFTFTYEYFVLQSTQSWLVLHDFLSDVKLRLHEDSLTFILQFKLAFTSHWWIGSILALFIWLKSEKIHCTFFIPFVASTLQGISYEFFQINNTKFKHCL